MDEKREQAQRDLRAAYRAVFNTKEAEKVLLDLADKSYFIKRLFDENPNIVYFREGRRDLYMYLLDMMEER